MKWISGLLFLVVITCSCSQSAISKKLSASDSLVITFNAPNSDAVIRVVETTEKTAIKKFVRLVDGKETERYKCGYDGNLVFYRKGEELLPIAFKYKENDCRHFLMDVDGQLLSTKMNGEAADLLASLEQGRNWY